MARVPEKLAAELAGQPAPRRGAGLLLLGMYAFMAALFWWSEVPQTPATIALYLFAGLLFLLLNTLYWPQLVLFRQTVPNRLRNVILFTAKYLRRVLEVCVLQLAYYLIYVLFAPWTLLLLPLLGVWYITFLSQFLLYDQLNEALRIEERISRSTGQGPA